MFIEYIINQIEQAFDKRNPEASGRPEAEETKPVNPFKIAVDDYDYEDRVKTPLKRTARAPAIRSNGQGLCHESFHAPNCEVRN